MLVEKEVIAPGTYWYTDNAGLPRKLEVTPNETRYWLEQGSAMLAQGLAVPVPYEHDFNAHPMTPKEKLLGNAGEVKEYRLKDFDDPKRGKVKDALFALVDVQDPDVKHKIGHSVRWTSPWFNSFVDGKGKHWNNVIAHLALTTRPRVIEQQPFGSIAAALSLAAEIKPSDKSIPQGGYCLSKAGLIGVRKKDKKVRPRYPVAFSLFSGVSLSEDDFPPKKDKKPGSEGGKPDNNPEPDEDEGFDEFEGDDFGEGGSKPGEESGSPGSNMIDLEPYGDPKGDISMEELLCDLLRALGVNCEYSGNEADFKRSLYTATMQKVHELTAKGMQKDEMPKPGEISKDKPPGSTPPNTTPNPLVQQEQQPMYMSLEDINKLPDPMKGVALAMYAENQKLRAQMEANEKTANSLRDAKLKQATQERGQRIALLSRLSPKVKQDLEAMQANAGMALSLGDGGEVVDPMSSILQVLEKGLSDMPRLLTTDSTLLSAQPHPTDSTEMSQERANELANGFARMMGVTEEPKKAG